MKFVAQEQFSGSHGYRLLPMRFRRLPWDDDRVFVSSLAGDWLILDRSTFERVVRKQIAHDDPLLADLEARYLVTTDLERSTLAPLLSQYRTRKSYLLDGPALHIFVVSLRCHHTCSYCQVSRQQTSATSFDLSDVASHHAVDRLFEWPSPSLTIEFQGGEPLLHFDRVRSITERIIARNRTENRSLRFVLASTLHDLTDEQLAFMKDHAFQLSTSLDGPEWLHNANRPRPERDSYRRTVDGIERGRSTLGADAVSALTTLTRRSLEAPQAIVDEYKKQGFHSISLRPLSPYGFAARTRDRNGYRIAEFLKFYDTAIDHLLKVNQAGFVLEESYASLLLSQLLGPFSHGYVDLRSPTGAGLGAIVYDYDGRVYPSDEARMLAAMGDHGFALGMVNEPIENWLSSPAMQRVMAAGVAEALPTCSDCAYVPLCGADPVDHYARQGDVIGHRPSSDFCQRQMGMFDLLLCKYELGSPQDRATLESWAFARQEPSAYQEAA
ncbi:His-Xaa-Ser system radical SAM maturase HxsB [Luteimonas sp. RD2P54]|uniref:His-Xaa-Ser system radical SAM maturase HxsB n=1 Tax=Luteimonas endophytica TaxID=3042023 RepID=A0ABT6JEH1_9GAMM|nr:His-Xaa-Ser system radical SAM maturase HxsB [Luteimonas endophytica]MDH5824960.1 His-Xaa-Ser system radical SAM maturase HxsB [Luteimonas endophytica]